MRKIQLVSELFGISTRGRHFCLVAVLSQPPANLPISISLRYFGRNPLDRVSAVVPEFWHEGLEINIVTKDL